MYLGLGLLIGFASIFVPTLIGALISRENLAKTLIIGGLASVAYGLIIWWISWAAAVCIYGPTPLFGWIIIGAVISAIIAGTSEEKGRAALPGITITILGIIYIVFFAWIPGWDMKSWDKKAKLITVEEKPLVGHVLELADNAHICLVNEAMARPKAEKALGDIKLPNNTNAGSQFVLGPGVKQFIDGQFWWIFPLEFSSYWKWDHDAYTPGFIRVSAENDKALGQPVLNNKQGKPIQMRYLQSACFEKQAERYLRNNGYLHAKLSDWTFEVDDDWNPQLSVSRSEWTLGYNGEMMTHVVVLNVQTGDISTCPISQVYNKYPWMDRAYDPDILRYQLEKWGEFAKAEWAWTQSNDGQRKKPAHHSYMVYDRGKSCWFTPWTSYSKSSDLIGISFSDGNTGKTEYYSLAGSTPLLADTIAQSHWSNYTGYQTTELTVYNIYGMLTYVIPIAYNQTVLKGVSLVSVMNKDINAKGETLEQALGSYANALAAANLQRQVPYDGQVKSLIITQKVAEVGMPFMQGQTQMYPFRLQGVDKIFQVGYNLQTPKVSFLKQGTEVVITYMDTKDPVITCSSFDIPDIKLSDKNPAQARWVDNQKNVKTETDRVGNIQQNKESIEGVDLSKIDPDTLKMFLDSQQKKIKK